MIDPLRQEIALSAHTVVVKVGSRVLTGADGSLDRERIGELNEILDGGRQVVLVSSGAVASGMGRLGLARRPADVAHLQAVAAIGQCHLVQAYEEHLSALGRHAAQVLLTADDLDLRARYLNVRNTIRVLLEYKAVPIINENDTVSVEELETTFGDNDRLAAMVANLLLAPLLVLLSDVPALFDGDPSDPRSRPIETVEQIDEAVMALVQDKATGLSKGGMASKLRAARMVTAAGENCIIASGREPGTLRRILAGERVGTLCLARGQALPSWKRWVGYTVQPRGSIRVDAGARRAVESLGKSLLAIGVAAVEGEFDKGDAVAVVDPSGAEFARGLSNYSAEELALIKGLHTDKIAERLGRRPYGEVIHRDNLVVTG
jgi:glutamate 5-kinase